MRQGARVAERRREDEFLRGPQAAEKQMRGVLSVAGGLDGRMDARRGTTIAASRNPLWASPLCEHHTLEPTSHTAFIILLL